MILKQSLQSISGVFREHSRPDSQVESNTRFVRIALMETLWLIVWVVAARPSHAAEYYVVPRGSDDGDGSIQAPWTRINSAIEQLKPGDTLYLRGGVYYESEIFIQARGRHDAKIVITSYPGEVAEIVAGRDISSSPENPFWELVSIDEAIYRCSQRFDSEPAGWILDTDELLWKYDSHRDFSAPQTSGRYCGPGVASINGQLFVRLQVNSHDGHLVDPEDRQRMLKGVDPNQCRLRLIESESAITISNSAHLELRNLRVHGGLTYGIELDGESKHILIQGCELRFNLYGIVVGSDCSKVEVTDCRIRNGFPEWGRWGDIKNGDPPPLESYNAAAVTIDGASGVSVTRNRFEKCFQGIVVDGEDFRIAENLFLRPHEGVLMTPVSSGEIASNLILHALEAFSLVGEDSKKKVGRIFIHHNIADLSTQRAVERRGNFGIFQRENTAGWNCFGSHDCNRKCEASRLFVYNNTFVGGNDSGHVGWHCEGTPLRSEFPHHVEYNNIFVSCGQSDLSPQTENVAGNITWSQNPELQNSEPAGLAIDPGIDLSKLQKANVEQSTLSDLRMLYRPTADQCLTPGKSYDGLQWPGVSGVDYRGAVP